MSGTPRFDVVDPASGARVRTVEGHSDQQVKEFIGQTHQAWRHWRHTSFAERAQVLHRTAEHLEAQCDRYASIMTEEMGKPIAQARSEVGKCAWVCRYYADNGESFLETEPVQTDASASYVAYRPLGIVLAVMPWNFPLWQVFRFAAPALMAGNAGLLKHASNVPGCACAIEEALRHGGLPEHVFRTLLISASQVEEVLDDRRVVAATLTGSTPAGRSVAAAAGERIKPTVLELGGSDAYVVLDDADLDLTVPACVTSRLINSGQSCIAAKRFIVVDAIYDAFVERFVEEFQGRPYGDPRDPDTQVGPQARIELRDELHEQVQRSIEAGARLVTGGRIPERDGAWYPPTILVDVPQDSPASREELFGPVAAIIRARDQEHAIELANDSTFGLGAAVFTRDVERGRHIAEVELEAGCCFVNAFVRSDPRLPFGGIKESGYGRELGRHGMHAFVNAKTVYVG